MVHRGRFVTSPNQYGTERGCVKRETNLFDSRMNGAVFHVVLEIEPYSLPLCVVWWLSTGDVREAGSDNPIAGFATWWR